MISQTGIHAVRALMALATVPKGEFDGAAAVAERVHAPRNYLGKLLQTMARQGLLLSQKGVGGGFALARAPREISLHDILLPIEDLGRLHGCFLGRGQCSQENPCHVHGSWGPIRDAYLAFLNETTLEDLTGAGGVERLNAFLASQ